MKRFITLGTVALIVAAVVTQWQRVRELGRQVLSRGTEERSVSAEENKALVRREMAELFNHTGNLDLVEEIIAPDYVSYEPTSGETRGIEGARQFAATYRQAFPDLENTIEDMVAEGDKVVVRFRARGTHQGETETFGSPTGKQMEITGITIKRVSEGKIVEAWTNFDAMGMMQQLGHIPSPEEAQA